MIVGMPAYASFKIWVKEGRMVVKCCEFSLERKNTA